MAKPNLQSITNYRISKANTCYKGYTASMCDADGGVVYQISHLTANEDTSMEEIRNMLIADVENFVQEHQIKLTEKSK